MDYLALLRTPFGRRILIGMLKMIDSRAAADGLIDTVLPLLPAQYRTVLAPESVGRRYVVGVLLGITGELANAKDPVADVEALISLVQSFTAQPAAKKRA